VNPGLYGLEADSSSVTTANVFRNNIFYSSGSAKQINVPNIGTGNIFEYNDVFSAASTVATWGGVDYTCANIADAGTGNLCVDPTFADIGTNNYHIPASSLIKDAGTSAGMPTGRTTDINNALASAHGFPSYADNQTQFCYGWDIGVDEYFIVCHPRELCPCP